MRRIASIILTLILAFTAFIPAQAAKPIAPANDQSIRSNIKPDKTLVLDFTATWCGPCALMTPAFKQAAEYSGDTATFMSIDVDKFPKTAAAFGVSAVPTIVMIPTDGEELRFVGVKDFLSELDSDATFDEKVEAICESLLISLQILDAISDY